MKAYDVDLIVIGAGPAGMAAAIRARWVKVAEAVPASVALLDPAGTGGIAAMGAINLTGPSFGFRGEDLVKHLRDDVEQFEIPVVRETAVAITPYEEGWVVQTEARTLRCLAVVLATGLRRLTNEPEIRKANALVFLAGGYGRSATIFTHWSEHHTGKRLVMIGGAALARDLPTFTQFDAGRNEITAVIEPRQRVCGYLHDGETVVVIVEEAGKRRKLRADKVMLDYHSLELAPPSLAFAPEICRPDGYSALGPTGSPAWPGLFAAGDCVGPPSASLKAMAQGSEAGFNAHAYIYARKFGCAPHLFAFYPSPARPPLDTPDIPEIDPARQMPVGLTAASGFPPLAFLERPVPLGFGGVAVSTSVREELGKKIATVHLREPEGGQGT